MVYEGLCTILVSEWMKLISAITWTENGREEGDIYSSDICPVRERYAPLYVEKTRTKDGRGYDRSGLRTEPGNTVWVLLKLNSAGLRVYSSFMHAVSSDSYNNPGGWWDSDYDSHFTGDKNEVQRGSGICLRPSS